jgi:hypothetical protein
MAIGISTSTSISIGISIRLTTSKQHGRSCPTDPTGVRAVPVLDMSTLLCYLVS